MDIDLLPGFARKISFWYLRVLAILTASILIHLKFLFFHLRWCIASFFAPLLEIKMIVQGGGELPLHLCHEVTITITITIATTRIELSQQSLDNHHTHHTVKFLNKKVTSSQTELGCTPIWSRIYFFINGRWFIVSVYFQILLFLGSPLTSRKCATRTTRRSAR